MNAMTNYLAVILFCFSLYAHADTTLPPDSICAMFGPAPRDYANRIIRNPAARRDFKRSNACPANGENRGACPGFVIDHIIALKRGGADHPCNMQWQTTEAAKLKDRVE